MGIMSSQQNIEDYFFIFVVQADLQLMQQK